MKNKYVYYWLMFFCLFAISACSTDRFSSFDEVELEEEYVTATVSVLIQGANNSLTRAGEPKEAIESLTVLVLDENEKFLYLAETKFDSRSSDGTYKYEVKYKISNKKRTFHYLANLDPDLESNLQNYEGVALFDDLMDQLSGEQRVYWAAHSFDQLTADSIASTKVFLLRNYAIVEVEVKDENFELLNYAVVNYVNRGRYVPKEYKQMMNISSPSESVKPTQVWQPSGVKHNKNTYFNDASMEPKVIFEQEHTEEYPLGVVIYVENKQSTGTEAKGYFKVDLIRGYDKNNAPIYVSPLRNHRYRIVINKVDFKLEKYSWNAAEGPAVNEKHELTEEQIDDSNLAVLAISHSEGMLVRKGQVFETEVYFEEGASNISLDPSWSAVDAYLGTASITAIPGDPNRARIKVSLKDNPPSVLKTFELTVKGKSSNKITLVSTVQIHIRPPFKWGSNAFEVSNNSPTYFYLSDVKLPDEYPDYLLPVRVQLQLNGATFSEYYKTYKDKYYKPIIQAGNGVFAYEFVLANKDKYELKFDKHLFPQESSASAVNLLFSSEYFEDKAVYVPAK